MDFPLSHPAIAAVRTSDRNVTITRDKAALTPHVHPDHTRPSRLLFRLNWLRRKFSSSPPPPPSFIWDISNPFDPEHDAYDLEEDDYDDLDDDEKTHDGDAEDEHEHDDQGKDEDCDSDAMDTDYGHKLPVDRPLNMPIALPQLLHNVPLRFLTSSVDVSSAPSEAETRVHSPPTLILYPSSESEPETETECDGEHPDKEELSSADLSVCNIAEVEERATRKVGRDAQRSRAKVLAILGPEASSAL